MDSSEWGQPVVSVVLSAIAHELNMLYVVYTKSCRTNLHKSIKYILKNSSKQWCKMSYSTHMCEQYISFRQNLKI